MKFPTPVASLFLSYQCCISSATTATTTTASLDTSPHRHADLAAFIAPSRSSSSSSSSSTCGSCPRTTRDFFTAATSNGANCKSSTQIFMTRFSATAKENLVFGSSWPLPSYSCSSSYLCWSSSLSSTSSISDLEGEPNKKQERTVEEEAFFARTKQLCKERNLSLAKIKNARDLASVRNSPVQPGRILRTGRVSDATPEDLELLFGQLGVRTLVDLRSPTELKDDPTLDREEVFGDFTSLIFVERKNGVVKELVRGEPRVKHRRLFKKLMGGGDSGGEKEKSRPKKTNPSQDANAGGDSLLTVTATEVTSTNIDTDTDADIANVSSGSGDGGDKLLLVSAVDVAALTAESQDEKDGLIVETNMEDAVFWEEDEDDDEDEEEEPVGTTVQNQQLSNTNRKETEQRKKRRYAKIYSPGSIHKDASRGDRKERHFVSIMNEIKYVKGTVSKVRKRDIAKVLIESPGALVSKRVRGHIKKPFLDEINGGGLPMLNELLLKYGAPGIHYVLDLCKDRSRHPIAFYCTAGKDRTGVIAAIMLAAIGVPEEDIVEDYSLSANVYAEMNDHKAMVGALSQRSLDAKTFLGAPPQVMRDTLANIRKDWGSVEGYLDWIGFNKEDRAQLKSALTDP